MLPLVFTLLVATTSTLANPAYLELVTHEAHRTIPSGFSFCGRPATDTTVNLRLSLVHGDLSGLEQALYGASSPDSDRYGQHLSREELARYAKPSETSMFKVNEWLSSHGLIAKSGSHAGDWLEVSVPLVKANELLAADFNVFTHDQTGQNTTRTLYYSIPAVLKNHINLVHPTVDFPTFVKPSTAPTFIPAGDSPLITRDIVEDVTSTLPTSCQTLTTPQCLQRLYGLPTTRPTNPSENSLFVTSFLGQYANTDDLQSFLAIQRPDLPHSTNFSTQSVDGGVNSQTVSEASSEGSLDIQYTVGLASGVPVTFLTVGPNEWEGEVAYATSMLDEANYLLGLDNPPHVLTTSYSFDEVNITQSMAQTICNAYMQLGARGTSVIVASGDGGVGGSHSTDCANKPFIAPFPGSCPYVTAVGGTKLGVGVTKEIAASYSTGGFSNFFPAPSWQTAATSSYIKSLGSTYAGLYNTTGRGIPDVATLATNYTIQVGGLPAIGGGTSASAPVFASTIALLNQALLAAGKAPLGFLNPLLYSQKGVTGFTDIVSGNNPGCNTTGFSAKAGWDPVTGLGTPDFSKLKTAVGL